MRSLVLFATLGVIAADWDALFPKVDLNSDGHLDKEEVLTYLRTGHLLVTQANKKEIIKQLKEAATNEFIKKDTNSDGFLDKSERKGETDKELKRIRRATGNMDDAASITLEQYIIAKNPHFENDHDTHMYFVAEDTMDDWDSDENGLLSYKEFDAWKESQRSNMHNYEKTLMDDNTLRITVSDVDPNAQKEEDEDDFKEYDTNKDNEWEMPELKAYMTTKGGQKWIKHADEFFMYCDTDKDGKITLKEVQAAKFLEGVKSAETMGTLSREL